MPMEIRVILLGRTEYLQAWRVQQAIHSRCQKSGENIVLITEHYPVVTLGYRRQAEQLRLPRSGLAEKGIALVESDRGGGATYHGPGQLVAYAIFSTLFRLHKVRVFVTLLEEVMRHVCASAGVAADRKLGLPGLWVAQRKIGAVGIAVRRGTSLHGFALNIDIALEPFSYIVPCGLTNIEITSLAREVRHAIDIRDVIPRTCRAFQEAFAAPVKEISQ